MLKCGQHCSVLLPRMHACGQVAAYKRGNPQSKTPAFIKGDDWEPFQPVDGITPPFPAFVSGHSTFGGAFETVREATHARHLVNHHCLGPLCMRQRPLQGGTAGGLQPQAAQNPWL